MPEIAIEPNDEELRAIDAELSQLLAVEPSPQFKADVRRRIAAAGPRPRRWVWALVPVSVAAAAALVVFAMRAVPVVQVPVGTHADIGLAAMERSVRPPSLRTQRLGVSPPPNTAPLRGRSEPALEPEILIDPSLAAAIRRLASERPPLPEVPPEPSLDPVVVEPLHVPEIGEFGGAGL